MSILSPTDMPQSFLPISMKWDTRSFTIFNVKNQLAALRYNYF